jgi:ATP-dependent DNA helicase RecQ
VELQKILKSVFGHDEFRGFQKEVIDDVLAGKDALVIMPTGGGKSVCFQIPALVFEGMTIVVSPLIALMKDQVNALKACGVKAEAYNSHLSSAELSRIENEAYKNEIKLLYISPEKLNSESTVTFLSRLQVSLIAIDEAHCVSLWGNDFRPDYLLLEKLRGIFPKSPCIALTASADDATQKDIIQKLKLVTEKKYVDSFERKNIFLRALPSQDRLKSILELLDKRPGQAGIIYCLSRNTTEQVAESLKKRNIKATHYHAMLSPDERNKVQDAFINDEIQVICATIAFGMGIDKSNIRWIVHYNLPKNIEGYYQEIGRSGRDGSESEALMFYGFQDYKIHLDMIVKNEADSEYQKLQIAKLDRIFASANTSDCRTNLLLSYFGEYKHEPCNHCDNCLNPKETFDGTILAQKALSAVARCNQQVNSTILIDILRGVSKDEIVKNKYNEIKTFGAGRDRFPTEWKSFITQFINQGLLSIAFNDFNRLKLTPLSAQVLSDQLKVKLEEVVIKAAKPEKPAAKKVATISTPGNKLVANLRAWRLLRAKEANVPPYVILHDSTIENIAAFKPTSLQDLGTVAGIGEHKIKKYGDQIVEIVNSFLN